MVFIVNDVGAAGFCSKVNVRQCFEMGVRKLAWLNFKQRCLTVYIHFVIMYQFLQ